MNDEMRAEIEQAEFSQPNLLRFMGQGWGNLQAFIATLSEVQLTQPTDAAGWTVKDHLIHLAAWHDSALALLEGRPQREGLNVDQATWEGGDDAINAVIQQRYRDLSLSEVRQRLAASYQRLRSKVESMTTEQLMRPHHHYQPGSGEEYPILASVAGNTFQHYGEHIPWMAAIAERK
jgi:uncharacterized protein (TIGR03083 family)